MNILLVTFSYPPINNAQAIRWKNLVSFWREFGCNVKIVAPEVCKNQEGVIPCYSGITTSKFLSPDASKKKKKSFYRWLLYFYEVLAFGDAYLEWAIRLYRCLRKIDMNKFDVVIFSMEPHISSVLPLLRISCSNLVIDIGDPPYSCYFSKLKVYDGIYRKILNKIFLKTSGVVYTGYSPKFCLEKKFHVLRQKMSTVIYQGYPVLLPSKFAKYSFNTRKIKLFFAGNFIEVIREPILLSRILKEFKDDIDFIHVGNDYWFSLFRKQLGDSYIYLGKLPHEKVINLYKKIDVLLYLGNSTSCQLSGKYFEYLGTKKPILHVYQNFQDDTLKIFSIMPFGFSSFYEELCLRLTFKRLISSFKTGRLPSCCRAGFDDIVSVFSWRSLAKSYLSFLEELVEASRKCNYSSL